MVMHGGKLLVTGFILLSFAPPVAAQSASLPTKTLQLSNVIEDTETSEVKTSAKVGTICLMGGKISIVKTKTAASYERFESLFTSEMRKKGFNIISTTQDMFSNAQDKNRGDFLLGATIRPALIRTCTSILGYKGEVDTIVEWQLYDRKAQTVVATLTTDGSGTVEKFDRLGMVTMWNNAFLANLNALVAKGEIQKYVGTPIPPALAAAQPVDTPKPAATGAK